VQELKVDNKELRIPSSRSMQEDPAEMKKKIDSMEKQLQRKEELLKRMT
jgi:hypothetical protein